MSTKSLDRSRGATRHSLRLLALVASLSLAMAGLVGLGLAPAASAVTCPAGYELDGDTCVKYQDAEYVPGEYYCEVGVLVEGNLCKVPDGTESKPATRTPDTYSCPDGGEVVGAKCVKDAISDGFSCPSGQETGHPDANKCYKWEWVCPWTSSVEEDSVVTDTCWKAWVFKGNATPKYKCENRIDDDSSLDTYNRWTLDGDKCKKDAKKTDGTWICEEGWTGPIWPVKVKPSGAETDTQVAPTCERPKYKYPPADRDYEWICPEGWEGPIYQEEWEPIDNYASNDLVKKAPQCMTTTDPEDPTVFSASASAQAGATVCVNDAPVGVGAIGSGSADSATSQEDAQTKAQAAANANAAANLNAEISKSGGSTSGSCGATPPVVAAATIAPVTAPAAATVAAPAPAKRPVKVPAPGSVSAGVAGSASSGSAAAGVPTSATVPSAVPAGDGSQAPALPMWALALIAVGVVGAAAAGKQMVGAKK